MACAYGLTEQIMHRRDILSGVKIARLIVG
jgi:hypothetical protein